MASPVTILAEPLCAWLSGWLAKERLSTQFHVTPLAGDGSPRPFYRIEIPQKTFVLLSEPAWTLSKDYPAHQAYLAARQVPVPQFFAVDEKLGVLLMQDLGDELLQTRILAEPAKRLKWLERATRLLAHLHGSTYPVPETLPVSQRRFDQQKYFEEFQFTFTHLNNGLFKAHAPSASVLTSVKEFCGALGRFTPMAFSHRDYHTRNLLVYQDQLKLIDFQDARLGPIEYDLASLFFDPYVPVSPTERTQLLGAYREALVKFPLSKQIDWDGFVPRLEQSAFQRLVKAAGSFASFFTRYGKKTHFPYLLPALLSARDLKTKLGSELPELPLDEWISCAKRIGT